MVIDVIQNKSPGIWIETGAEFYYFIPDQALASPGIATFEVPTIPTGPMI